MERFEFKPIDNQSNFNTGLARADRNQTGITDKRSISRPLLQRFKVAL
jgi:hypothetical protein